MATHVDSQVTTVDTLSRRHQQHTTSNHQFHTETASSTLINDSKWLITNSTEQQSIRSYLKQLSIRIKSTGTVNDVDSVLSSFRQTHVKSFYGKPRCLHLVLS